MADLGILAPITTAATALSNLVLVTPQNTQGYQPQIQDGTNSQQPPALLFHYEGENTVALESDITDHYVEDNTAIQDQWAIRPEIVTVHGYIGELNDIAPKQLQALQKIADKLTVVGAYLPALSETALIAYNEAFLAYQVAQNAINSGVSAWAALNGGNSAGNTIGGENVIGSSGIESNAFNPGTGQVNNTQNKQQVMFQQFYGYWHARTLFTVQTPWAVFRNMAILGVRAVQDADTRMITDFEVRFKMIRFTSTVLTNGLTPIFQGRASTQAASLVDLGTTSGQPVNTAPVFRQIVGIQ